MPNPCSGPIAWSVFRIIRSRVPCSTSDFLATSLFPLDIANKIAGFLWNVHREAAAAIRQTAGAICRLIKDMPRWSDQFVRDLRFGGRYLAKSRMFAAVTIGSLALGIGGSTAMYS